MNTLKQNTYVSLAIGVITFVVFSPVLWHGFINLDDPHTVYANNIVQSGISMGSIYLAFTTLYDGIWIPLTWVSLMIDVELFGHGPMGHHLVNLLLHITSSVILSQIFIKTTKAPVKSALIALLFALHPMHVQSVAWAAERKDVLSAFFGLSAMYSYLMYADKRGTFWYLITLFLFMCSLMAKAMLVTLPVLLLLLDWWPLHRYGVDKLTLKIFLQRTYALVMEKVPFLLATLAVSIVTYKAQSVAGGIVTEHSFLERCLRACISYCTYIYKMFVPLKLSVFYPFVKTYPELHIIAGSILLLLIISVTVLWQNKNYPFLSTGWLWFLVSLLPMIGLIQVGEHSIADHYSYIPFIGLFIMLVWGGELIAEQWKLPARYVGFFCGFIFIATIVLTSLQLRFWKNTQTLLGHALDVTENNWLVLNNLGLECLATNRVDDAMWYFREAIKAKPSYVMALVNLAGMHALRGENKQARDLLIKALCYEPTNELANVYLSTLR